MNNAIRRKSKMALAAALAIAAAATCLADTKTTYRDAQGRVTGTKTVK